jgi:hypothetical protein
MLLYLILGQQNVTVSSSPFLLRQVPIPNKGTTYWCQMFKIPVFQEKHHVIKVCDSFTGRNEKEIAVLK